MADAFLPLLAAELGISPDELRAAIFHGDEALTPTYLTVDAQGRVTAQFLGGIEINAATTADFGGAGLLPPQAEDVRWIRQSDGAFLADIYAYDGVATTVSQAGLRARDPAGAPDNQHTGASTASVVVSTGYEGSTHSRVEAFATETPGPGYGFRIVDSQGYSDFPHVVEQGILAGQDQGHIVQVTPGMYFCHCVVHGANREAEYSAFVGVPEANNLGYAFGLLTSADYNALGANCFVTDPWGNTDTSAQAYVLQASGLPPALTFNWQTNTIPCSLYFTCTKMSAPL